MAGGAARRRGEGRRRVVGLVDQSRVAAYARGMPDPVSIGEAKTHLSRLVARVEAGEEVVLRRGPVPVAKLVPYAAPSTPRTPGALRGRIRIGEDFDDPIPGFEAYGG